MRSERIVPHDVVQAKPLNDDYDIMQIIDFMMY